MSFESSSIGEAPNGSRGLLIAAALAVAVVAVGQRIPLPGLDLELIDAQAAQSGGLGSRASILALGINPLFTALALAEIGRLVFFALTRRDGGAAHDMRRGTVAVRLVALALTALQGVGLLAVLEESVLADPEAVAFEAVGLASYLGATAVLVWLTERCRPFGIWPLFCVPFLIGAPNEAWTWVQMARTGAASLGDWLLPIGYIVAAVAATVFAHLSLVHSLRSVDEREGVAISILVWPPFLAGIAVALVLLPLVAWMPSLADSIERFTSVRVLALVVFVPLLVWLYARRYELAGSGMAGSIAPVLVVVAATQVAVCVAGDFVLRFAAVPLSLAGGPLIALVTVMLAFGRLVGLPERLSRRYAHPEASLAP